MSTNDLTVQALFSLFNMYEHEWVQGLEGGGQARARSFSHRMVLLVKHKVGCPLNLCVFLDCDPAQDTEIDQIPTCRHAELDVDLLKPYIMHHQTRKSALQYHAERNEQMLANFMHHTIKCQPVPRANEQTHLPQSCTNNINICQYHTPANNIAPANKHVCQYNAHTNEQKSMPPDTMYGQPVCSLEKRANKRTRMLASTMCKQKKKEDCF